MKEFELNDEQTKLLKLMEESNKNMLVIGKGGVGKSEVLKRFLATTNKKYVALASTGVASINIGGQTIHSFFNLPIGIQNVGDQNLLHIRKDLRAIIQKLEVIIIDEISMISPDIFEVIDLKCKIARKSHESFGGIQIICFGDLYQLSPVIDEDVYPYYMKVYGGKFFFNSPSYKNGNFTIYELQKIHRQKDEKFKNLLNEIREGDVSIETLNLLNKRVISNNIELGKEVVTLTTTRDAAQRINAEKLAKLTTKKYVYSAKVKGDMKKSSFPAEELLELKVGAKVMMLVNSKGYVNGSIGEITNLDANEIEVKINNVKYLVEKHTWEKYKYSFNYETNNIEKEIESTFTQYPVTLAWAFTIHKSQGKSYSSTLVDLNNGAFASGQVYVALSRCETLDKLYLTQPIKLRDIKISPEVKKFLNDTTIVSFNNNEERKDDRNDNSNEL